MRITEPSMYCLACRYVLDGLDASRCPECGRGFDPDDPTTFADRPGRDYKQAFLAVGRACLERLRDPWVVVPLVWVTSWAPLALTTHFMRLPSVLAWPWMFATFATIPLILLGSALHLARRRWLAAAMILVLTPFALYFISGVRDYGRGAAQLKSMGELPPAYWVATSDPTYRCPRTTLGCVILVSAVQVRLCPFAVTPLFDVTYVHPSGQAPTCGMGPRAALCVAPPAARLETARTWSMPCPVFE